MQQPMLGLSGHLKCSNRCFSAFQKQTAMAHLQVLNHLNYNTFQFWLLPISSWSRLGQIHKGMQEKNRWHAERTRGESHRGGNLYSIS